MLIKTRLDYHVESKYIQLANVNLNLPSDKMQKLLYSLRPWGTFLNLYQPFYLHIIIGQKENKLNVRSYNREGERFDVPCKFPEWLLPYVINLENYTFNDYYGSNIYGNFTNSLPMIQSEIRKIFPNLQCATNGFSILMPNYKRIYLYNGISQVGFIQCYYEGCSAVPGQIN